MFWRMISAVIVVIFPCVAFADNTDTEKIFIRGRIIASLDLVAGNDARLPTITVDRADLPTAGVSMICDAGGGATVSLSNAEASDAGAQCGHVAISGENDMTVTVQATLESATPDALVTPRCVTSRGVAVSEAGAKAVVGDDIWCGASVEVAATTGTVDYVGAVAVTVTYN